MKKILFISYLLFLILFSLFSYLFIDPNLFYLKLFYTGFAFTHREVVTILYTVSLIIFFGFYLVLIYLFNKKVISPKELIFLIICSTVILFLAYPAMLSYDIFNYIATAKVSFFYHENPYIVMPIEFIGDPLLRFVHAANKIALYGPIWIGLTSVPWLLGFQIFVLILFLFKFYTVGFYVLTLFVIYKLTKNWQSVLLFGLQPLILIEILVSGHNDIVMICFALLSFLMLQKKKIGWAIAFILLSIGIKYATIFLLPIFLFVLFKTCQKRNIHWDMMYFWSACLMLLIFLLSPIREEIYPWYATWILSFLVLIPERKILLNLFTVFSFGLLLRYIPFMLLGTYFGPTPLIKILVTNIPLVIYFILLFITRKVIKK